jgi:DNA repair exonuclease SbcCD ATPase subunit
MSFTIRDLTVKNFMSVGNATQAVKFNRNDLTLVLGQNLDLGGDDTGARNGTGKTTIINALSYALYGEALTRIRKENLINKTNGKNMMVTIEFDKDGVSYKIERGRKPNVMKFFIGDHEQEQKEDESQGDSRETQAAIERLLGISHDMFKHIVALNTYTEPFLSLKANDQRVMIEQLLGVTQLSEKAENLKEQIKTTKDSITKEEFRIKAVQDANQRMQDQIANLRRRQKLWQDKKSEDLDRLAVAYGELDKIDIEAELLAHQQLAEHAVKKQAIDQLAKYIAQNQRDEARENKVVEKLKTEIASLEEHRCHACGQELHDNNHETLLAAKKKEMQEAALNALAANTQYIENTAALKELGDLELAPATFYEREADAFEHRASLGAILGQITAKQDEADPYAEQIVEMETKALEQVDYDEMNRLISLRDHQDFLLKLLTSKDSYVRKRIIDQNLSYLNQRLGHYLDKIGLPHTVTFQNDLTVEITELGRELDFDNLSRGERNRLILSLSWAFRDVWESLYQPINLLFIDEVVDSGMDSSGVESALAILKKMARDRNKSVWLVSHKDELSGRVNNVLTVTKENGFTSYDTDVDTPA